MLWFSLQFRQQPITFNYLPNARVVNYILNKKINISNHVKCKMLCHNVDSLLLRTYINQSKVDFKKSKIRNTVCKKYHLSNSAVNFVFTNCHDTLNLIDFVIKDTICDKCN